jgi:hypothetical protein
MPAALDRLLEFVHMWIGRRQMAVFSTLRLLVLVVLVGCQGKPSSDMSTIEPVPAPMGADADIRANLSQLGPEDQQLAEHQKYCPMMEGVRLGEMGRPYKVTVQGDSMFVCCKSCVLAAQKEPDRALENIRDLRLVRTKELSDTSTTR